ncbi:MAG: hypothetical protein ACQKBY_04015, partial [Verrucomicrobiales bacterium]
MKSSTASRTHRATAAPALLALLAVSPAHAAWVLMDNFDSYDNSTVTNVGAHANGDATGGAWDGVWDGTSNAVISDVSGTNNAMELWGTEDGTGGAWRGMETD